MRILLHDIANPERQILLWVKRIRYVDDYKQGASVFYKGGCRFDVIETAEEISSLIFLHERKD